MSLIPIVMSEEKKHATNISDASDIGQCCRAVAKSYFSFKPPEQRVLCRNDKRLRVWHERHWSVLVWRTVQGRCY